MPVISPRDMNPVTSTVAPIKAPLRQVDTIVDPAKVETETKTETPLSPKFAELARREQLYLQKRKEFEAREAQLKSKEAEYQSADDYKASLKGKFTQAPLEALSELGLSYDQITQLMLNQPKPEELQFQQLQKEIKELRAAQEKSVIDSQTQAKTQYEQAVSQIRNEVKMLIDSNEAYESVKAMGAQDAVVELIEQTFKEKGLLLSVEDASKEVEDYLVEEAFKMAQLKKVQARMKPTETPVETKAIPKPEAQTITTLTNNVSHGASKPLSNKERRERAILAFKGQLQG